MHFISAPHRNITEQSISNSFEENRIIAPNELGTDEESTAVDWENDNKTFIYDFNDYIPENFATCEAERATVPSADDLRGFSSTNEDELKRNSSTAHSFFQYCIEELTNNERLFSLS